MSVRLDDSRRICKVLVSSQTTGQNVIELLKPDDDYVYYLAEIWKGCERPIAHEEKLKNVLLQWGSDIDDVVFVLKRKHPSKQKRSKSPRNSPVPAQLEEKQQKVENLEKELQQKEQHLKSLRNKETSKSSLKTKYVRLLEMRVIEQEEKLSSLYSVQDELFKYRVENEKLVLELNRLRSLFVLKHQQLAEATARVELLSRELARASQSQQKEISNDGGSTLERNAQHPSYKSNAQSNVQRRQLVNHQGQRLTEAQLLQLQTNSGYATSTLNNSGQPYHGRDILFLKHGILHEQDDLNSLLSWQNDEENDTETSADSGHVSNDSPPYQNRFDPSFQFYPNPPEMYCAKVERFDIDQECSGQPTNEKKNQGGVRPDTQDLRGLSKVDGWPQLQPRLQPSQLQSSAFKPGSLYGNAVRRPNYNQQMFVNTDPQPGGVGFFLKQQQFSRDSPQSTSSLSSLSSESSKNDPQALSFSGTRSSIPKEAANGNDVKSKTSSSGHVLSSAGRVIATTGTCGEKPNSNPGSQTTTPTNEYKPFIPNEGSCDARESSTSRTAGSISHYQRRRENSMDNSNPVSLGPFLKERRASQTSDSSSESSNYRVRTPSIEKPAVPNTLMIPKANDSKTNHLSPTVTDSNIAPKFNQKNQGTSDSPTSKSRSRTPPVSQSGHSSPVVLNVTGQNTENRTQQGSVDRNSPMSKEQLVPRVKDSKGRYSPGIFDPKDSPSDRGNETSNRSSSRVADPKGRSSPRVSDPRAETPVADTRSKANKDDINKAPLSSQGVQELLNDMPALKVTAREVKPIQIQTKAEKDYDNITVEKSSIKATNMSNPETKLPTDKQTKRVYKPPKPLPRKRTKTPPARCSGNETNPVVTSSQQNVEANSGGSTVKVNSREQSKDCKTQMQSTKETDGGLGTKAYDSILRRNKGGKKSGKRVSLDPHAVLLHASLEGELELVKNVIHQVEDPSYPNNEGLTALHHAVCNSHDDIVKFLIEYGCDINAADMQGWTSLHCAAANNSIDMCKFLINHGACVFAVTAIEGKTPSRCCEKDSENFEECFAYLSDVENNFGVSNDGVVYAVYAYQANRKDELSFECGERLTVVRRGDVNEKEWWWARDTRNQFGYIPRNLLGLHPPVAPDV